MNKKILGIIAIVVLVLVGYMLMKRVPAPGDAMMHDGMMMDGPHSGAMTAAEILKSGKDQKCTFTRTDANAESAGTVYFSKGKMRGEFDVTAQGQTFKASMMSDGNDVYTWGSMMPQGIKTPVSSGATNDPRNESFDLDDMVDYNCSSWNANSSMFELPSDVKFSEIPMGAGSGPAGTMGSDVMKAQQCAACDTLTDAAQKSQCKAALSCN